MTSSLSIKNTTLLTILISFMFLLALPVFVSAQTPINTPPVVPSETNTGDSSLVWICHDGRPGECTFNDVINAVRRVVNWATLFAIQFSVVVIAWAGFKYMNSDGNPGKRAEANKMLLSVVKGIVFILLAWLIVTLITGALVNDNIDTFLG